MRFLRAEGDVLALERTAAKKRVVAVTNRGDAAVPFRTPWEKKRAVDALTGRTYHAEDGVLEIELAGLTGLLLM
jgi:hypothetical protein